MQSCLPLVLYVDDTPSRLTQLRRQIPYFKAMGYQGICYAQIDESDEKAALFQEDFLFHDIEPSSILLNAPFVKHEDVLAQIQAFKDAHYLQQMEQYATLYQGGVIAILNKKNQSNTIEQLEAQLSKLTVSEKIEFQDISLSLGGDFKTPLRKFLQTHALSIPYGESIRPMVLQKLQRVDHQFEVRQNSETTQYDAIICVQDIADFEQRAVKIKRKLGVNCRFAMCGSTPLLVIPHVIHFEIQRKILQAPVGPAKLIDSLALANLTTLLEALKVLPSPESAKISFEDSIISATLTLPVGSEIELKGQKIVKLKLIFSLNIRELKSAYVIAQGTDGVKTVYQKSDAWLIEKEFILAGAFFEKAFTQFYHLRDKPDWKNTPIQFVYDDSKRNFYRLVHQKVARTLVDNIIQSEKSHQIAHTQGVLVFSFGCGEGAELNAVKMALSQEQIDAQCIGFDLNPQNFQSKLEGIELHEGDMLHTSRLIAPHLQNSKKLKVGLFIGSLVQQILEGTQQAVAVLQQARHLDMIVITGYTDPFITKSIAKAIGWKVKATNISHEVQESPLALEKAGLSRVVGFYELSRMNAADRKHYLTKRGIRRSSKAIFDCLDLSLSDSPLRDISLFDNRELEQLKLIDLSWCALTQDDFQQLISRIESLNRRDLKIIISGTESWLDYLDVDSLKGKYVFIERTDFQPNHVNVFTQSETRLLKLFKEPPYRNSELFKQKLKKEDELDAVCHSLEDFINTLYEIKDKEQPPFDIAEPLVMNTLKFYGTAIKKATGFFVTNPLESSTFSLSDTRPFEFDLLKSRLLVTTRKGDRKQFRIKSNAELKVLQKALSNGYSESTLLPKNIEDIPWRILTTEKVYSSSAMVRTYYENHHNFLPAKIFDLINGQESLLRKGKQYGLSVYSFGCGNANDLIGVESLMSSHGIKCNHAIGIDVNPDNFPKAIKKGITLLHGNMQNLESTILPYIQKNDLKIGLFIGSLANQCLPNGMQEAVGILQQAKSMDMIFLSGVTKPLLLKWIAKGMGWHFNGSTSDIDMDESHAKTSNGKMNFNMYVLRAMNNEDRKKYLIKRGTKRTKANAFHCLDLSMSADPVRDINLFSDDELKAIKQIDLSWSAMNNDELKAISTRICGLNNKELIIIISKTEPWLGKIKDLKQFTFFIREDHDKDKVPTLQPHIARALGVYSSLPGRKTKFQ